MNMVKSGLLFLKKNISFAGKYLTSLELKMPNFRDIVYI